MLTLPGNAQAARTRAERYGALKALDRLLVTGTMYHARDMPPLLALCLK